MTYLKSIKPGKKHFKVFVAKSVLFILGRAFLFFSKKDPVVKREVAQWAEGFKLELNILPSGPKLVILKKTGSLRIKKEDDKKSDLSINFKNIESAILILTPQMGIPQGFAEHRFIVIGDVSGAMSFVRCLNMILAYLYPDFICKNILRSIPEIAFLPRMLKRLHFYTLGLIVGK